MDCYSIYQLSIIKPCGCIRQYINTSIREWQSWMVWAYRTRLHATNHLVLAKCKFYALKHVPFYIPPPAGSTILLYIMTNSLGTFTPWSFNWCHEHLNPTCATGPSISWLKIVIISRIASGLMLFLRVNPNLRNLFFKVLSEIFRLWYAAKKFTIVKYEKPWWK